ncbi:hypothetical protein [Mesorhizobium comanense]|uniref:hypothetical protein n=1 Tax=Mesorhizobium comanense TaxID=2502215 RepID=UPI0010F56AE2|nr:hypothetical protein [Mesorhizobium comanense]
MPTDLKLKWAKTWIDHENDFVAIDRRMKGGTVGRIYTFENGPTKGKWFWTLTAHGKGLAAAEGQTRGYAESAREAGAEVERAWFSRAREVPADAPDGSVGS